MQEKKDGWFSYVAEIKKEDVLSLKQKDEARINSASTKRGNDLPASF